MSYIDAKAAPARNTGQIKLYVAAAFEGMRPESTGRHPDKAEEGGY